MNESAFFRELRKGRPDIARAERGMKWLSRFCFFAGLWNFGFYFATPYVTRNPFNLPPEYPYLALITLSTVATLSFWSAQRLKEAEPSGKLIGQIAIVFLLGVVIGFVFLVAPSTIRPDEKTISAPFILFGILFIAQATVMAYFGVRYLGRLPINNLGIQRGRYPNRKQ